MSRVTIVLCRQSIKKIKFFFPDNPRKKREKSKKLHYIIHQNSWSFSRTRNPFNALWSWFRISFQNFFPYQNFFSYHLLNFHSSQHVYVWTYALYTYPTQLERKFFNLRKSTIMVRRSSDSTDRSCERPKLRFWNIKYFTNWKIQPGDDCIFGMQLTCCNILNELLPVNMIKWINKINWLITNIFYHFSWSTIYTATVKAKLACIYKY